MREKRFLRVLTMSFILGLGILLFLNLLSFEFSTHDQKLAIAADDYIRTSSFLGYPTSYLGGLGAGLYGYPALGVMPITQQISLAQVTPFTTSTLNSSYYRDPLTMYGTQASTFTNPFATYGSASMQYMDPFSQAAANTTSYRNIFGVSLNQGQGFYRDPFYSTGGKYINYSSPVGGFSSDMAYSMTPMGGTTHLGSSLTTPWTHYSTNINTAAGVLGAGTSIQHQAFGTPTVYNMMGFSPQVAGTLNLLTYGHETAAMDRMLSNTYAYTKEGMPFIPVASYYNPASVGGTNYFFEGDISYQEAGTVGTGPFTTGYSVVQEVPSSLVPAAGLGIATSSALANAAIAGYVGTGISPTFGFTGTSAATTSAATTGGWVGSGAATSPYGGWTGGAVPVGAATTGVSGGAFAGFGAPPAGAAFAGWGAAPSGASFGMVSGGWGPAGGGFAGGGFAGGGFAGGGFAGGGAVGGGAVGGGFTSGAGVAYGGAPGLGW